MKRRPVSHCRSPAARGRGMTPATGERIYRQWLTDSPQLTQYRAWQVHTVFATWDLIEVHKLWGSIIFDDLSGDWDASIWPLTLSKCQNPLHQFLGSKSVTSWRGHKSVLSVVSCRFPNSITTTQRTCCQLVVDLLAISQCHDSLLCRNKLATSPFTRKLRGNVSNGQ